VQKLRQKFLPDIGHEETPAAESLPLIDFKTYFSVFTEIKLK
jgi:hypothetical protein